MSNDLTNTFQQRRQLAIAVAEMANATTMPELATAARNIYDAYPDDLIQAELIKNLDTPDSQLRGGLGLLATHLPDDQIRDSLRTVAADRSQSAQRRLTAAMIASQYLDQPIPAALLSDLSQGNEVAFQSLLEAVEEGKRNRHILLEYVLQMRDAGDHVPPLIMDLLERLPAADRVEMLRLIALDDREAVAINALSRLELLAASDEDIEAGASALRALHVLQFMLPPDLVYLAQDALRRLRFRGKVYRPPQPHNWRALISPTDVFGNHAIWFIRMPSDDTDGEILRVTVNEYGRHIFVNSEVAIGADEVVPPAPVGQLVPVTRDDGATVHLLEAPLNIARWCMLRIVPAQWQATGTLPPEFRLYADGIFQFDTPSTPPEWRHYFADPAQQADTDVGTYMGEMTSEELETIAVERTIALIDDPLAARWLQQNQSIVLASPDSLANTQGMDVEYVARYVQAQFEQHPDREEMTRAVAAGLHTQAAWFNLAGYAETAERFNRLAQVIRRVPISRNPLLIVLLQLRLQSEQ